MGGCLGTTALFAWMSSGEGNSARATWRASVVIPNTETAAALTLRNSDC